MWRADVAGSVPLMNVDAHLVVPDAEEAARWYASAFGARELAASRFLATG